MLPELPRPNLHHEKKKESCYLTDYQPHPLRTNLVIFRWHLNAIAPPPDKGCFGRRKRYHLYSSVPDIYPYCRRREQLPSKHPTLGEGARIVIRWPHQHSPHTGAKDRPEGPGSYIGSSVVRITKCSDRVLTEERREGAGRGGEAGRQGTEGKRRLAVS